VTIPIPASPQFGATLWAQSAVLLAANFDPVVTDWTQIRGFTTFSDELGLWYEAADAFVIPAGAPAEVIVRMNAQALLENTSTGAVGGGLGFGVDQVDPFLSVNGAAYNALQIPRRQDFPIATIQVATPFFIGAPGSAYTLSVYQQTANALVVAAAPLPDLPPPSHCWWAFEVWA
jgi:hypothetical protein